MGERRGSMGRRRGFGELEKVLRERRRGRSEFFLVVFGSFGRRVGVLGVFWEV